MTEQRESDSSLQAALGAIDARTEKKGSDQDTKLHERREKIGQTDAVTEKKR